VATAVAKEEVIQHIYQIFQRLVILGTMQTMTKNRRLLV
jgi:hypothetical protein